MSANDNVSEVEIVPSCGNVFADLGLPYDEERMLKAHSVRAITSILSKMKLTQVQVAEKLGVEQSKISLLLKGRLEELSLKEIVQFLNVLLNDGNEKE